VALEAYHDWSGEAAGARLRVNFTLKLLLSHAELLQPALNEIHKFCFQHWSRGHGTCGTGSGAPANHCLNDDAAVTKHCSPLQALRNGSWNTCRV